MVYTAVMSDAHLSEPTFTAMATRDGTYCIRMDQHTDFSCCRLSP
jgi:hypothetical protein